MTTLPMDALTLDEELQPRAAIDRTVLENYVQLLVDGVRFPPVVAFRDGNVLWLADGFHRWHSRNVLELDDIDVDVTEGSRRDALLYSLSANATHGLQRGATDYRRAYEIACRNGLVDPVDIEAVAALLHCTGRWATTLTERARAAAKAERDSAIIAGQEAGKTVRQIAKDTGASLGTISGVQKRKSSENEQPAGFLSEVAKADLRELAGPAAKNWSGALEALRLINEQVPVETLFADRFYKFDHVFGPQLEAAHEWINELHGKFVNERQRRRA